VLLLAARTIVAAFVERKAECLSGFRNQATIVVPGETVRRKHCPDLGLRDLLAKHDVNGCAHPRQGRGPEPERLQRSA
jgi:hypothetical protein